MNFITFPVSTTNIFPAANDTSGAQLLTEYNLRSRESVDTNHEIDYFVGKSYTHSPDDFKVRLLQDGAGNIISYTTLEILPGRAVINGHFVETFSPMVIDLVEGNAKAATIGEPPLKGGLTIGLRCMYSTQSTMAGSILVNNTDNMYEGIQVVVLPSTEFKTPKDVPNDESLVTAHLKLGTFMYVNGAINSLVSETDSKCKSIEGYRISDIDRLLSSTYITKSGLNPKKLYTFSGKEADPSTGRDTWCDSTDSLMIWDNNPTLTLTAPSVTSATFGRDSSGYTVLTMPHKQVDGMTDTQGHAQYYADKTIRLPAADFNSSSAGTVTPTYTSHIKNISAKLDNFYHLTNGKQVSYIDKLTDRSNLPAINPNWSAGDYVLVGQDFTVIDDVTTQYSIPSTMYVIVPGVVNGLSYAGQSATGSVPSALTGVELASQSGTDTPNTSTSDHTWENTLFGISSGTWAGAKDIDYFKYIHINGSSSTSYYYKVLSSGLMNYSDPLYLTREIPLAQEELVGGFLNVPEDTTDGGYVYRDASGHLRLLDYMLLRSGTLAYQLGQDMTISAGLTTAEVQNQLDEYVNQRIAFANDEHIANGENEHVINLNIFLGRETSAKTITIKEIDSRFNTCVYIHINGDADSYTTINIVDCQKVRIDNNIVGTPTINLIRSSLYYDASVLNYLNHIEGLQLWYEQFNSADPKLIVDGLTVQEVDGPIIPNDIDYWNDSTPNDNHYMFALRNITFSPSGDVVGCSVYVRNETTSNIQTGSFIIASEFVLPQGAGLTYPKSKLTKQLKVSGSFVNAYPTTNDSTTGYMVEDTNFTMLTDKYDPYDPSIHTKGTVSFYVVSQYVTNAIGLPSGTSIDGWESNSFHIFSGGAVG